MLVAMLADSGLVSFDDPVTQYATEVQFADPYVTARDQAGGTCSSISRGFGDTGLHVGHRGLDSRRIRAACGSCRPSEFRSRFQSNK